ncbi:MAG TPA: sigma-70 family RNA polymerase sigma factor [Solirubrobacterales bacterium]|nr:sigma-70 family RNA polymerase sigma factor [Solirubrobacterales bacterium]
MRFTADERLVRRAKRGDRRAFEAIFERYHQDLYRFCLTLVGSRQDAEDALQATMVKVLRSLPGERRDIQLRPWIYRIARNESIDTVRRRRETVGIVPEQIVAGPGLIETAESRERLGKLIDDLGELPERQRAALVMRELGDLEFGEIAAALETSADAARQAVYEARVSLRQMEAGREMSCDSVVGAISEADGRVVRKREIQAHLKSCADCRAFQQSISRRRGELRAIAPLPVAASAAILHGALGTGSGAGAGAAGAASAGAGKALLGSAVVKTAATCAVVAAIGTTAADRSGLVDVPIGGSSAPVEESSPSTSQSSSGGSTSPSRSQKHAAAHSAGGSKIGQGGRRGVSAENRGAGSGTAPTGSATGGNPATTSVPAPQSAQQGARGGSKSKKNATRPGQGKAPGLPPSSDHGQQTAAEHRSPQGNASPGTPREPEKAHPSHPQPPPKPEVEPAPEKESAPVIPAPEAPAYEKGENSANRAAREQPELAERSE